MKFTSTSFPRQVSLSKHLSEQSYLYKDSLWWVSLFKIWHEWEIFRTKKKFIFSHLHYREKYVLHIFHKESKGIRMITISLLFLNFHWCTFFFCFCLFFFFQTFLLTQTWRQLPARMKTWDQMEISLLKLSAETLERSSDWTTTESL